MIQEHVIFEITPGQESEFEQAYARARGLLFEHGAQTAELSRGIENPSRYLLLVHWDSVEAHTEGFRGSPAFTEWRSIIGPFFANLPEMTHFSPILLP